MQQHGEKQSKQHIDRRLLVVDDDPAFCAFLDDALSDAGYATYSYTDPVAALAALRTGAIHPDVVLLDLVMPMHTGRDIIAALRLEPALRAIPVVLISALPVPNPAVALGVAAVLRKPLVSGTLVALFWTAAFAVGRAARWEIRPPLIWAANIGIREIGAGDRGRIEAGCARAGTRSKRRVGGLRALASLVLSHTIARSALSHVTP